MKEELIEANILSVLKQIEQADDISDKIAICLSILQPSLDTLKLILGEEGYKRIIYDFIFSDLTSDEYYFIVSDNKAIQTVKNSLVDAKTMSDTIQNSYISSYSLNGVYVGKYQKNNNEWVFTPAEKPVTNIINFSEYKKLH